MQLSSFLVLSGLRKTFSDGTHAVRGIDMEVKRGEFIVLLGPSGCGKTTTLRMIAGLEQPSGGRILLDGVEVTHHRPSQRDVGMVFQFYALYPHLSVRENIGFPLRCAGLDPSRVKSEVDGVAERLALGPLLSRYPRQLSGGDQQKVSLARAIVRRPKLYLMDEPLGTLDTEQRVGLRELIRERQTQEGVTTLYVTHDQEEAMSLADRVVVMARGEARQVGAPAVVYDRPANLFVARFVGSPGMNFIHGEIRHVSDRAEFIYPNAPLPFALAEPLPPGPVVLGVRAEHLVISEVISAAISEAGGFYGTVERVEYLGVCQNIHLTGAFGRVVIRASLQRRISRGDEVRFAPDPAHMSWFNPETEARL